MPSAPDRDDGDMRRLAEAAAWRIHLTETGAESSEGFEAWLGDDPGNAIAWKCIAAPWDLFGEQAAAPELLQARRAALGRATDAGRRRWRPRRTLYLAVAGLATIAVAIGFLSWQKTRVDIYRTALGERRIVTLADGSRISLDSATDVQVRYSRQARDLWLTSGQARFDVAHDAERPFSVTAGSEKILATGTAFNIDMMGPRILVTLIEGRVVVIDQSSEPLGTKPGQVDPRAVAWPRRVELRAGQQLVAFPSAPPAIETVNVERATAWQSGQLVFEDEPLASVIDRLSRYTRRSLRVQDEQAARIRISGVFNAGDLDGFVETLTRYLPIRVEPGEDGVLVFSSNN